MKLKNYIKGASLLESVIAISIISGCLLVGLQVFSSVNKVTTPKEYYQLRFQQNKQLSELVLNSIDMAEQEDIDFEEAVKTSFGTLTAFELKLPKGKMKLWTYKTQKP